MIKKIVVRVVLGRSQKAGRVMYIPTALEKLFWQELENKLTQQFYRKTSSPDSIGVCEESDESYRFQIPHPDPDTTRDGVNRALQQFQDDFLKYHLDSLGDQAKSEFQDMMAVFIKRFPDRAHYTVEQLTQKAA